MACPQLSTFDSGLSTMKTSDAGKARIKQLETCRLTAFWDVNGYSIGWGEHGVPEGTVWTQEYADQRFAQRIDHIDCVIDAQVSVPLTQNQRDALASFIYNVGDGSARAGTGFVGSTLLRKLNKSDYRAAADEFLRWCHAGSQVNTALLERRALESNLFLTPDSGPMVSDVEIAT